MTNLSNDELVRVAACCNVVNIADVCKRNYLGGPARECITDTGRFHLQSRLAGDTSDESKIILL